MPQDALLTAFKELRRAVEHVECSNFYSILGYNTLHFLQAYRHITSRCIETLGTPDNANPHAVLYEECYRFSRQDILDAPFSAQTKKSAFFENICEMLNIPAFEDEMAKPQSAPDMAFMKCVWEEYHTQLRTIAPDT